MSQVKVPESETAHPCAAVGTAAERRVWGLEFAVVVEKGKRGIKWRPTLHEADGKHKTALPDRNASRLPALAAMASTAAEWPQPRNPLVQIPWQLAASRVHQGHALPIAPSCTQHRAKK
jgi:hypothetical protein